MKKIILLLLIYNISYGQFELTPNQTNGKYSLATNNETFMGISSGNISASVNFTVSDTSSNWTLLANQTNGKYSIITNAVPFMGKSAGTVQIPVVFDIGTIFADTSNIAYTNIENSFSSTQTFNDIVVNETVNIYGGLNILSGGYQIYGRTENQNVTFTRHHSDGDLLSFQISSTGTTLAYWDSTTNTTTALKVGNGTITANDSAIASRNWVKNNISNLNNNFTVAQSFSGINQRHYSHTYADGDTIPTNYDVYFVQFGTDGDAAYLPSVSAKANQVIYIANTGVEAGVLYYLSVAESYNIPAGRGIQLFSNGTYWYLISETN